MSGLQRLATANVDVWLCDVDADDAAAVAWYRDDWLTAEERLRLSRLHFAKDRRLFVTARMMVRRVLSEYQALGARDLRFTTTEFGKPVLAGQHELHFNLSHTDGLVALAVAKSRVGVDVERPSRDTTALAGRVLNHAERERWKSLEPDARTTRLIEVWTLKEAYVKADGRGLSLPLTSFGFEFPDMAGLRFTHSGLPMPVRPWSFWQWRVGNSHILALCAEGANRGYRCVEIHRLEHPLGDARKASLQLLRTDADWDAQFVRSDELGQGV